MKLVNGWYLPDYDDHFIDPNVYESHKIHIVQKHLSNKRTFIDVGAHIGIWSINLSSVFQKIYAFEPNILNYQCLVVNIKNRNINNIIPCNAALLDYNGICGTKHLSGSNNSGNIGTTKKGYICSATLDSFNLDEVDLIKIDTQGSEYKVLLGAIKTITENNPIILLEQEDNKKGKRLLKNNDYYLRQMAGNDYVFRKGKQERTYREVDKKPREIKKQIQEQIHREKKIRKEKEKKKMEKRKLKRFK